MKRALKIATVVALGMLAVGASLFATEPGQSALDLQRLSLSQLEQRLVEIDGQLERLSQYSPLSGAGAIGYRSNTHPSAENKEWIEVDLEKEHSLDEIILVPTIWRDTVQGFRADGFPIEFRVLAGVGESREGKVVATFDAGDGLLPRIAPLVIPCRDVTASWVRVEATSLSSRYFDGRHLLQLAEILVFSGPENVALGSSVQTSSEPHYKSPGWDSQYLVDGFMPYQMNSATGRQSVAFVSGIGIGDRPSLTVDLDTAQSISHIHLHLVDQSDTVPQAFPGDFGVPRLLRIEGANQQDFSGATVLTELIHKTSYDIGPIIMRRFPKTDCRYVRLTAIDPYQFSFGQLQGSRIGFAEIEIFSRGQNIALGRQFTAVFGAGGPTRKLAALTDGNNHYGRILPVRDWLDELTRRHDLETARPLVAAELNLRYLQQQKNINHLLWLVCLLGLAAICTVLVERIIRQRAVFRTRETIAADLHDEIGANIHAIGLLGDLAQASSDSPEKLKSLLGRMRELTERTGKAAGYCANMLEAKGLYDDLEEEMRRSSARIMADLEHDISFEGEEILDGLKPRKRIDLYLFHKECLINILRHSGATRVKTSLKVDRSELCLTVTDNGCGLSDSPAENGVPPSLKRRARLVGGQVSAEHPESGGTSINLRVRL